MRRKDREITDHAKQMEILKACDVCRIGICDEGGAYIVPMNFGYEEKEDGLYLYFHGAAEGRKLELLKKNPLVGFEMDTKHSLVEADAACGYSFLYQSVIGKGSAELVEDLGERVRGMKIVMDHYTPGKTWEIPEEAMKGTMVICLKVNEMAAKEH